ncbi:Fanconi anemia group A protein isoform X1 [Astyanax mexicanus]|uniref:Fanconi anemia group A protein isoform X1 n=1 Tax=Astyanax mexicanus TaxID=7994 RepID=UPI0020CAA114|nr:Fanconi anemia group A protein isoform X1 [Astyanax mexicanus]
MSVEGLSANQRAHRTSFDSLIAGRALKKRRLQSDQELQQAALQLISHNNDLSELMLETRAGPQERGGVCDHTDDVQTAGKITGSLLVGELQRQAGELGVPVGVLCVRVLTEKLTGINMQGDREMAMIKPTQRAKLIVILQAVQELLGLFSPKLLWQQYWKTQPVLEVVFHLHREKILPLEYTLHSDPAVCEWLVCQLQGVCESRVSDPEDTDVRKQILSSVVCVLVRAGFEEGQDAAVPQSCCSVLDHMLSWQLESVGETECSRSVPAAGVWLQVFDPSLFGVSVSEEVLRCFFIHSLTHIFTHRPRLKVSDAISMQSQWSFTKTPPLLTALYSKVCALFQVEEVFAHLQQVLETHEVNWQNVLSCVSTLLVYDKRTQSCLKELLYRLLTAAFETYDMERMITGFLLARQAALEGPAVFPSYRDWFKMAFGGASSYHSNSKKSLVFLLKFLSDIVPFEPPQYLKVHVMHPPLVMVKHRSVLQEYVALARTRLSDLKVSVEEMGLYEVVSGNVAEEQCPAQQDVEKAVALFESTGRISATVMEASIFRRPYFLSRFLPALLKPRVLPEEPDYRMNFIESLRKAEKIPVALYSSYIESCLRQKHTHIHGVCSSLDQKENPLLTVQTQLLELRRLLSAAASEGDIRAQLALVSYTLSSVWAEGPDSSSADTVVTLALDQPPPSHTTAAVVNLILQSFCQCVLEACRVSPPNRHVQWAGQFVKVLVGHTQLYSALLHRLFQLLHSQGPSLAGSHVLGLAVLLVELHACRSVCSPVRLSSTHSSSFSPAEALSTTLPISTKHHMNFSLRLCVAAVCYAVCRSCFHTEDLSHFIPPNLYRQLLFLMPRLMPDMRPCVLAEVNADVCSEEENEMEYVSTWSNIVDPSVCVRSSARALWAHNTVRKLQNHLKYQLSFSQWLRAELRVQRSVDALTDTERQVYERWVCQQWFLPRCVSSGGCGGDLETACRGIVTALLDTGILPVQFPRAPPHIDSCCTDILSRLQELLWELQCSRLGNRTVREEGHFLWEIINRTCTDPSDSSDPESLNRDLQLQRSMHACNSVLLAVPAVVLVGVQFIGGRSVLDCHALMENINTHQRRVCSPAGVLTCSLTAHFLTAVFSASVRCESPAEAVNLALSQISMQCPLLLLSAGRWWRCISPVICSLWGRMVGGEEPALLHLLNTCHEWANGSADGLLAVPSAPAPLLAVCLYTTFQKQGGDTKHITANLPLSDHNREVLVYLLFFYLTDFLSAHLKPQVDKVLNHSKDVSVHLLTLLVDYFDWLSLFHQSQSEHIIYRCIAKLTPDTLLRLMPFALFSVLAEVDQSVLIRAAKAPAFLHTVVMSYTALLKLFLHGHTDTCSSGKPHQILCKGQKILLKSISLSRPGALSHSQQSQLEAECTELDPEVAAALHMLQSHNLGLDV